MPEFPMQFLTKKYGKLYGLRYFLGVLYRGHRELEPYSQNFLQQTLKIFVTLDLNILRFYRQKVPFKSKYH